MFFYQFPNHFTQQAFPWVFWEQPVNQQTFLPMYQEMGPVNNLCLSPGTGLDSMQPGSPYKLDEPSSLKKPLALEVQPNCPSTQILKKFSGDTKEKINSYEEEFKPYASETKKGRKTPQNGNRNVVPNIMHQAISFMQKKTKSMKSVEKIIRVLNLEQICSVRRFYLYQLLIKDKLNYYVNADSLILLNDLQEPTCSVYSQQQQRHYNKISRMLVEYFLKQEFDPIILTSKRVNTEKRLDHLRIKRRILARISEILE